MKKIDLHIHSNLSDGDLSIEKIIKLASQNDCKMISITDHDHIMDDIYSKNDSEIKIIPGVELNTTKEGMHILGYGMCKKDSLEIRLRELNQINENVCLEVIRLLQKDGFDISKEQIKEYYRSLQLPCDIIDKKKIVKYLIYKNYTKNVLETYNTLIGKKQKYYVPIEKMTERECIERIKECGGISVLAHPSTLKLNSTDLYRQVKELAKEGLDGIEIINNKISLNDTIYYQYLAASFDLARTVGSDFHIETKQNLGIDTDELLTFEFEERMHRAKKLVRF